MKILKNHILLLISLLLIASAAYGQSDQIVKASEDLGIKYEVVSQRRLTLKEMLNTLAPDELCCITHTVRMRLKNESKKQRYYLVYNDGSIYPWGRVCSRKIVSKKQPQLIPDCRDYPADALGEDFFTYLIISPGVSIEFDTIGLHSSDKEFSKSAIIKADKNGPPMEVFTKYFRVL